MGERHREETETESGISALYSSTRFFCGVSCFGAISKIYAVRWLGSPFFQFQSDDAELNERISSQTRDETAETIAKNRAWLEVRYASSQERLATLQTQFPFQSFAPSSLGADR